MSKAEAEKIIRDVLSKLNLTIAQHDLLQKAVSVLVENKPEVK